MPEDFTVTICDPERSKEWEAIFGTVTVPVESPFPTLASLPGLPDVPAYKLDLELITPEQHEKLVSFLAEKFELPTGEVEELLDAHGMPIFADNCVLGVGIPLEWD